MLYIICKNILKIYVYGQSLNIRFGLLSRITGVDQLMEWYLTIQTASAMEQKLFTGYNVTIYCLLNRLLPILKMLFFSFLCLQFFFFGTNFHSSHDSNEAQKWCLITHYCLNVMNCEIEKGPFYILWFLGTPSFPQEFFYRP